MSTPRVPKRAKVAQAVKAEPLSFDQVAATKSVTALKGLVRNPASTVSIAAMNAAVAGHGKTPS